MFDHDFNAFQAHFSLALFQVSQHDTKHNLKWKKNSKNQVMIFLRLFASFHL